MCLRVYVLKHQDSDDAPKGFHTDCDLVRHPDGGEVDVVYPIGSSVLYLGSEGGPTAIFGQRPRPGGGLEPTLPQSVAVSFPVPNQYLWFGGDLYHAVLHPRIPLGTSTRYTLLMNFWGYRTPATPDTCAF